jgi:hypothetical protein
MTQAGTPQALIESLQANNPLENTSIGKALKFNTYLTAVGLGYESIVAIKTAGILGGDGAEEFALANLTAAGISQDAPLYLHGKTGSTQYNVALDLQLIAGSDPLNSYAKLYAVRHPGASISDAMGALLSLPLIATPINTILGKLKNDTGIF